MEEFEDLFLKSLDGSLSDRDKEILSTSIQKDARLEKTSNQYLQVRQLLHRQEDDSFGPFFAERIINHIRTVKSQIDYQIFFFFKKYQLAVVGIIIALVAINIVLSDKLSVKSVLGLEEIAQEEIVFIDLYEGLTE